MSERLRDSSWDRHGVINGIIGGIPLPKMARIEQKFVDNGLKDIPGTIAKEFAKPEIASSIKPGMTVAITAGSRGIANLAVIIKETVEQIKKLGGKPFIFPAMGSHGGATAEGQLEVLASYGVTEKTMGVPIKSSMETIVIGTTAEGKSVYLDKNASQADGVVVVGRVKPHTAFRGKYESGLMKMMVIGMGKQKGAESCHDEGFGKMAYYVEHFGDVHLAKSKILFGVAIVENAFDQTCKIEAVAKDKIKEREPVLLQEAKSLMPQILIPKFDILVVDQIGKNFSGDGADPNVTGTYCTPFASGGPEFQRYVILDLSDETHGNGIGLGMAEFTTKRAFDKFDFDASYPNGLTSTVVSVLRIPVVLKSDKEALQAALHVCTGIDKKKPKIVRIKNTSHIEEIMISEALMDEARRHPQIRIIEEPKDLDFDKDGNLKDVGAKH
jgi:hypothetical protein